MGARRIICLTTSYPLEPDSSSGVFVARLAEALNKSARVTVLTPAYKSIGGRLRSPLTVHAFRYAPARWQTLCHAPGGIPAALRERRARALLVPLLLLAMLCKTLAVGRKQDVIQANWAVCGAIAAIASRLRRRQVVTTLRGDDVNSATTSLVNRLLLKTAVKHSTAVVAVSEDLRQQFIDAFNVEAESIAVIPNGVDDDFLAVGRARNRVDETAPLSLITVGSLIPRKNVGFILRALPALPDGCSLTIVGEGQLETELRKQVQALRLGARVDFKGKAAPAEIPGLLANHDVLVLASFSEGRSNAVYEAMAAGLTVVASDIPGTREQIESGRNGFLFDLDSTDGFVDIITRLHANRALLSATGRCAHRWIIDNDLTWDAAAERYLQLFDATGRGPG